MKKVIFMLTMIFMISSNHHLVQASEPLTKIESEEWEVSISKTDFSKEDKRVSKCDETCTSFHIVTKNKNGKKYDVMTMITYEGGSKVDYGYGKATGFHKENKEFIDEDQVLTDFGNYPLRKNRESIEILFIWSDQDKIYKETLTVPINHN